MEKGKRKKVERFEDLEVWQESMKLSVQIYNALSACKDFGLRDQMQRASVSVASNIAEGFDRNSSRDFIRFLYIARGSCAELRTQLYLAMKVEAIGKQLGVELIETTKRISAMLLNLIRTREAWA